MRRTISMIALLLLCSAPAFAGRFSTNAPATTNNDDSCDVGVFPAATLLLPYFEVDFRSAQSTARTTLMTVTNTSNLPQIAKVTMWTDWAYPVIDFNLFLTGYDVQALNLYDILGRGIIASTSGTSIAITPGEISLANDANPNFAGNVALFCAPGVLPGRIPSGLLQDIRTAFTVGTSSSCNAARIGGGHANAIGYVTVDVVSSCSVSLPTMSVYWDELLYDNVLIGDYAQVDPNPVTGNYAGGSPMVHVRAVPEGGPAKATPPVNLPYTFYDRFTASSGARTRDRRQPLSSAFAARFVQGGPGAFNTNLKIWREAATSGIATCADYRQNNTLPLSEVVRFDEHENPTSLVPAFLELPILPPTLPATESVSTAVNELFPPLAGSGDVGGWIYLNLHDDGTDPYTVPHRRARQNWVVVSMSADGRYSVDMDANPLGNGCSPALPLSTASLGAAAIGPMPQTNP